MSARSLTQVHGHFEAALPAIVAAAEFAFRKRRRQDREDAVAEAQAAAWAAWAGLVERGKDPRAVGVWGIAANAVRYVQNGRRVGNRHCGRGAMDVHHPRAQMRDRFQVVSLDATVEPVSGRGDEGWREWLAQDNRCTPADEAAFRIDFANWLGTLPPRKHQMAVLLAEGHETGVVATTLGVTPGAVSQTRVWLEASWRAFQAEAVAIV
jgi:hypothetical protein